MTYLPEPKVSRFTRWTYVGCPGVGTDDLMRPSYGDGRKVSPGWHRAPGRSRSTVARCTDGLGTISPKTKAAADGKKAYALRCELGERAYADLTGRKVRRSPAPKPKVVEPKATPEAEVVRQKVYSAGASAVVLSDRELMKALGIQAVGYLE